MIGYYTGSICGFLTTSNTLNVLLMPLFYTQHLVSILFSIIIFPSIWWVNYERQKMVVSMYNEMVVSKTEIEKVIKLTELKTKFQEIEVQTNST